MQMSLPCAIWIFSLSSGGDAYVGGSGVREHDVVPAVVVVVFVVGCGGDDGGST